MQQSSDRDLMMARRLEHEMQRMADDALRAFLMGDPPPDRFWQPHVDVYETDDAVLVKMELAGVDSSKLRVNLASDGRSLAVSGERTEEEPERTARTRCHRLEIYFGPFECRIALPSGARYLRDAISARYVNGILAIHLPKRPVLTIAVQDQSEPK
ncbi:MAG: Hsp20/alpha crystallin family protein [Chthonomonadales bacterium]|nr:Hsp20/alpha crystallin family protein [Chthonomonadales bacterium]